MERIRFIAHRGKQVLLVDLSHSSPAEAEATVRGLPDYVTTQPPRSVRLLVDFTGASFNDEALRTMKEAAVFDKMHIKRTAWIGADSLPASFQHEISKFSRRDFPVFQSSVAALDWLIEE